MEPNVGPVHMHQLPLTPADREYLLAALEVALAVCAGNGGAARRLALAYPPGELGPRLDALADRVFALGRRPDVWQTVIGSTR
jgi:hypothetical protein